MKATYRTSLLVLFAALWPVIWLAIPFLLFSMFGGSTQNAVRPISLLYADALRSMHIPVADMVPARFIATVFVAGAILGTTIILILTKVLDPQSHSKHALRWSLRTMPCLVVWYFGAACIGPAIYLIDPRGDLNDIAWLCGAVLIGYALTMPFFCLRPDIVANERPPMFWTPRWPGASAVSIGGVAIAIGIALNLGFFEAQWLSLGVLVRVPQLIWGMSVVSYLTQWIVGLMLIAGVLTAWLHGWKWRQLISDRRLWLNPTSLRSLAAVDLQLDWALILLLLPPIFAGRVCMEFVLPQIHADLHMHGTPPSSLLHVIASTMYWFVSYWWLLVLPTMFWLANASMARALHLVEVAKSRRDG